MATASQLVKIAASQIGVKENPAGSNKVKYWDYYKSHSGLNLNGSPWCVAFVTWCMSETGAWSFTKDEGRFRYCPSLVNWAKSNGQWVDRSKGAKPGDIVLFGNGSEACHVGFVEKVNSSTQIQTIEGNTSVTSNDNGGSVMRRTRDYGTVGSKWYVMGFVRTPLDVWYEDSNGWWLGHPNGTYPANKWVKLDTWYWFNNAGYAIRNCWKKLKGFWYLFDAECHMLTGWHKRKGFWYWMNTAKDGKWPEGSARTGWKEIKSKRYYFEPSTTNKSWPECSAHTGWVTDNGKKYYLRKISDGGTECAMVTGTLKIGDKTYKFDSSGACLNS